LPSAIAVSGGANGAAGHTATRRNPAVTMGSVWNSLADLKMGILFVIGGDGTFRGAQKIAKEANRQGMASASLAFRKRSKMMSPSFRKERAGKPT
jgi:6-phosphofructokinase